MAFLIIDSGSTKTHWVLMSEGRILKEFNGDGMNAYVHTDEQIIKAISQANTELESETFAEEVFFYGAGCSTDRNRERIKILFETNGFSKASVAVQHDLLAAARSLFNKNEGIACILGTGSSSCHINNGEIQDRLPSLGYIIGDEGGGFDLGGRLLRSVLKGHAPKEISDLFALEYKMTVDEVISRIYSEAKPNKFIASFTPFLSRNINYAYCQDIVKEAFTSFIKLDVLAYKAEIPVGFIGSVAYAFQDILKEVMQSKNLTIGNIYKSPMKGLIEYHSHN